MRARRTRRECDGLPVIAGGCSDDAARPLSISESGNGVVRTAQLEGASPLPAFELEEDVAAGFRAQCVGSLGRCAMRGTVDTLLRGAYLLECRPVLSLHRLGP